jgi:ferredoxin
VVREVSESVHEVGPLPSWDDQPGAEPTRLPELDSDPVGESSATTSDVLDRIRVTAANLLKSGEVELFIGYRDGLRPGILAPTMVTSSDQVGSLEFGKGAVHNLAAYLADAGDREGRVGMVAKRCDVAAVEGLIREGQIRREDVRLVGVPCGGVVENGETPAKCATCSGEPDPVCDLVITAPGARGADAVADSVDPRDRQVAFLESLPAADRWRYWQTQFRRCLRCYACRASCPLCYCSSCISEQHRPQWIPTAIDEKGNTAWNVIRALHLAGRCTGCDQCSTACPADIRLDLLNRKLALEVERQFGGGLSPGERAALTEFRMDDAEDFIL